MTTEAVKKNRAEQELRIVDVSERNRAKGARKSVIVLLTCALAFGLAFAAVADGAHISRYAGEPPFEDDGSERLPLDKPPMPDAYGIDGGIRPVNLPV